VKCWDDEAPVAAESARVANCDSAFAGSNVDTSQRVNAADKRIINGRQT
jgi:hypothetical protein